MKKTCLLGISAILFIFPYALSAWAAITTTSAAIGEDVVWSLSNVSSSLIIPVGCTNNASPGFDPTNEICVYTAPLHSNSTVTVQVDIPNVRQLDSPVFAVHQIWANIPYRGTRWVTKLRWNMGDAPQPTSMHMAHRAGFDPYQADPAYPSYSDDGWPDYQPDKNIIIQVNTVTNEEGNRALSIYIVPDTLIGINNPEQNGLPRFARTEPNTKYKKPYGCNGCSEMGLPGYRVNMANLLPVFQDTLFQWAGRGPAVDLTMTWNANQASSPTNFGTGWRFSYDSWLTESSEGVTIEQGSGGKLRFEIPSGSNANVISVTPLATGDVEMEVEYQGAVDEPSYTADWDGTFSPDRSGYRLEKDLDGDASLVTFILYPPDEKLSYIFQGPYGTTDLPLVAVEDWNGNRLQLSRNASGAITSITDAVSRSASLSYNLSGQCESLTVPGGNQVDFSYSGSDLVRVVDLIDNQTDYTYDADHLITEMNTEGRVWQFDWATLLDTDYLGSVTDPDGNTTQYNIFNSTFSLRKTQIIDPSSRSFIYEYPNGQYRTNSRARMPTVISDHMGRPVVVQQKDSSETRELEYNELGAVSRLKEYDGGVHTYTYDSRGLVTEYLDALGNSWLSDYDLNGNLIRTESPAGRIYQYSYDTYGQLLQATDPEGNVTTMTYDGFGNLASITDAEDSTTTLGYDANGFDLTSITDPLQQTTSFSYDANRRRTRVTHPDSGYQETFYDCCSETGVRNENGDQRSVTRSASLEILSETDYLGNTVNYSYDGAGRQVEMSDPEGRKTITSYNNLGQLTEVQAPDGDSVEWLYYSNTDELFSQTLSRELGVQVPLSLSWRGMPFRVNDYTFTRDRMGRLLYAYTPRTPPYYYKNYFQYNRDDDGLLTSIDFNGAPVATFTRNLNGTLASSTHQLGTDEYERNGRNQVTRQVWFDGLSVDLSYDAAGQIASISYPDDSTAIYSYDTRGRIDTISWKGVSLQTEYDAVGNVTGEVRSNGVNTSVVSDKNSQLTRVRHYSASEDLLDLQCTRNVRGLIEACTKAGDAVIWIPALATVNLSSTYGYNHSFTIVTHNGEAAVTDAAGNQSAIPGPRSFSGTFDYRDLLTSWTTSTGINEAVYDGRNRLIEWTRGDVVRRFHYDEFDRLLFETDGSDNLTAMWLYRGTQIVAMADTGGLYFYHNDLSANVAFLTDIGGQIVAAYRYLPYGLQTASRSMVHNPFTFVGSFGVIDLGDGLYYMRSRTYDSVSRAFLSNDPLGMGVTANAREYARNNPVNWIDPDGRHGFLSQYSSGGATGPRTGADFSNKVYNQPTMNYEPPRGGGGGESDGCFISTSAIKNFLGSTKFGISLALEQFSKHFAQEDYESAADDIIGLGIGFISGPAGVMSNFIQVPNGGNRPSPYDVTFPQFSLEN